jgi:hypothetical protein
MKVKSSRIIIGLVKTPPQLRIPIAEGIYENELSTWYVDPFLSELFDSTDEGTFLRWTNEMTLKGRKNEDLWTYLFTSLIYSLSFIERCFQLTLYC